MPTAAPIRVCALGAAIEVRFDAAPSGTREAFADAWARARGAAARRPTAEPIVVDAPQAFDVETAMHHLSGQVTLAAIEAAAGRTWMLHAAGLATAGGATVALVAPSGTGKSTACRVLGRRLGYLSDETVAVAADGSVLPHPKPLSIVRPGSDLKAQVSPDQAGLAPAPEEPRLRVVVLLDRDGTETPRLETVRTAAALPALAEQTSYLTRLPRPLSFLDDILARTAGVHRLHYRDIEDAADLVEGLLR